MSSPIGFNRDVNLSPGYHPEPAKTQTCTTSEKTSASLGRDGASVSRETNRTDCENPNCKTSATHPDYKPGGFCIIV